MKVRDKADVAKVKNFLMSLPKDKNDKPISEEVIDCFIKNAIEDETTFDCALEMLNRKNKNLTQSEAFNVLDQVLWCK